MNLVKWVLLGEGRGWGKAVVAGSHNSLVRKGRGFLQEEKLLK